MHKNTQVMHFHLTPQDTEFDNTSVDTSTTKKNRKETQYTMSVTREMVARQRGRILRTYTSDQKGQDIKDEDVIRAWNGIGYTQDEQDHFKDTHRSEQPTYGNCILCRSAGPVGKECACDACLPRYQVIGVTHDWNSDTIIDAEYYAKMFGASVEVAKADRFITWLQSPYRRITETQLRSMLRTKHKDDEAAYKKEHDKTMIGLWREPWYED